jgi:ABC-type Fe3+ transport system substrate-binding protein
VKAVATAEETWHEPIVYPGAVIKGAADAAGGKAFLDYMGSEAGKAALIAHGFLAGGEAKSGGAGAKSDDAGAKSGGAEAGNVDAPSSRPSP